jgi:hypothetical protein
MQSDASINGDMFVLAIMIALSTTIGTTNFIPFIIFSLEKR